MSAARAYAELRTLPSPLVTTRDAAARLRLSLSAASRLLRHLAGLGLVTRIRRGLWALTEVSPYAVVPYLTAPYPAYVSLWTALYEHGMIAQVPRVIYAASLDRSKRVATALGIYRIHYLAPRLFGGFDHTPRGPIARAPKALFDTVYIVGTYAGHKMGLPEIELPRGFDRSEVDVWVNRIASPRRRIFVARRLDAILKRARPTGAASRRRRRG